MPARKIKPEVLRPLILAVAILVALFVMQFLRPIPPDIRREQLRKAYTADLEQLYAAAQQYQGRYGVLPGEWSDLLKAGFSPESLQLPDLEPKRPVVVRTDGAAQMQNMPFALLLQGQMDLAGSRKPLIEFKGTKEAPPATLYTDGTIEWAGKH